MRPVSAAAVCPVHDSPFRAGLGVRGPALQGRHSSGLRGGWRPLPVRRFDLQDFVLSWTLRYGSGLSQVFQRFHRLSVILHVSTRWHKTGGFGLNMCNSDILVFHEKSVFHILSDLCTWEGEQWAPVGGRRGGGLLLLGRGRGGQVELLLLGQPLQQLLLPRARLLLPTQLLLLEDLFSQALLFFYLQAIQPRFFVFVGELQENTHLLYCGAGGEAS